jgi:hypothetical protein
MFIACFWIFSAHADPSGLITAKGFGTVDLSQVTIKSQAVMMARRAAQLDAQRNLAEQIRGVRLTGGTTMQEYEVSSDIVATRVKGFLRGAFETDQQVIEDSQSILVEIELSVCADHSHELCAMRETLLDIQGSVDSSSKAN